MICGFYSKTFKAIIALTNEKIILFFLHTLAYIKNEKQAIFQHTQMRFESNSNALVCMTADVEHESHELAWIIHLHYFKIIFKLTWITQVT